MHQGSVTSAPESVTLRASAQPVTLNASGTDTSMTSSDYYRREILDLLEGRNRMPLSKPKEPTIPESPSLGDYVNKIVVLFPTEAQSDFETKNGPADIIRADAWEYTEGQLVDIGSVVVFWTRVRDQLQALVGTGEAVVGRIVRNGRAYELVEVTDDEQKRIDKLWDNLEEEKF